MTESKLIEDNFSDKPLKKLEFGVLVIYTVKSEGYTIFIFATAKPSETLDILLNCLTTQMVSTRLI
jgi:hypothetical protein